MFFKFPNQNETRKGGTITTIIYLMPFEKKGKILTHLKLTTIPIFCLLVSGTCALC